ncbi:MAG: radical SAM protein [Deltaproteobacteria bacterium]|nr:radical SAM protein [Deltaproteobacteria bacterium]
MIKIFMLNPPYVAGFCRSARWAAKSRGRVQRHPDGMLIAAAVLERVGFEVTFVDGAALNLTQAQVAARLKDTRPHLTVIHTTTPSIYNDLSYAALAKEASGGITVLIGPHVTALPGETILMGQPGVDFVARGEYDQTLLEMAESLAGAEMTNRDEVLDQLRHIPGLTYLDAEDRVVHNPDRPPLDVDWLPFPAWHHIRPEWYQDAGKRFPFLTLISGRGCHGRCTFCRDVKLMEGRKLRMRRPELVVDEMVSDLQQFPNLKEIMFETDTFTAIESHVTGVCQEILRRGLKIIWSCNARVDMDVKLMPLMKRAGCRMLMVGFEFGTQEALDAVKKGTTLDQARRFAQAARRAGLIIHGCFMIGAPGETRESALKTIEFAQSLPMDTVQFSGICTYPGTEMYDWAKQQGYLIPQDWTEWVGPDCEQVTLLSYPQLSKPEIDRLIDLGLKRFYLRPTQMIKMVTAIRSFEDLKRKLFGLKGFADYFSGKK